MSVSTPRYVEKFTDIAGSVSYTLPLNLYQLQQAQPLRSAYAVVAGAHYAYDQLGTARSIKDNAVETYSGQISGANGAAVDTELDLLRSKLFKIGGGKLYVVDSAAARRWAYGRILRMPTEKLQTGDVNLIRLDLDFARASDWYDTSGYNTDFTIDATPKSLTVVNAGNERIYNAVLTLKGTYSAAWTILNTTNGYQIAGTHSGAAASNWLKIDAGQHSVKFSSDSGATYTGIYSTVTLPTTQIALMVLEPGNNAFTVTGANGATLHVDFDAAYA
jgi:hypothetical protein